MQPNYVKNRANRTSCILAVLLMALVPPTAQAKLTISSQSMAISVEETTGKIADVAIKSVGAESDEMVAILREGNLLSLGNAAAYTIRSQEVLENEKDEAAIVTVFDLEDGVSLRREIALGVRSQPLRISYNLNNQSSRILDIQKSGISRLTFGIGFEGIEDLKGGYGSSVYAYRDPFFSDYKSPAMVERLTLSQLPITELLGWFGWANRYYVIAVRLPGDRASNGVNLGLLKASDSVDSDVIAPKQITIDPGITQILQPGESLEFEIEVVIAPKSRESLSTTEPRLDGVVLMNLWNWFRWICNAIGQVLAGIFSLTNNWGLTLILAALLVRIVTIPITRISLQYQERAAAQQKRIQPLLSEVKEKYSGLDLSQQIVNLYEKEEFDQLLPFKSMLGLFIQIPIFIALFNVLAEVPELSGASFLWIDDLAVSDRLFSLGVNLPFFGGYFNLLPFVMAFVTVLSTYYASKDPTKSELQFGALFGMAGIFFVLFYTFPAALVLYWTASNFFQLLQQLVENRSRFVKPN
jgi:YidC/Oxa1 family membrane protein insertase